MLLFNDWEDDAHQRRGEAFEFTEDEAAKPLMPLRGPIGWRDDDFRGLVAAPGVRGPCSFVEHHAFRLTVGVVIFANALVLYLESTRLRLPFSGNTLNTVFLTAYGVELALRIVHFRLGFFVEMPDAPWNWVDFAIVISGVLDEWLVDLLSDGHGHNALLALRIMQPLRFFGRAFRFLRYLRLLRFLLTSDLAWVESGWFQGAVGVMIILNAVFMGIETDVDFPLWSWVEQGMLAFFLAELAFRLRLRGCGFFTDVEDRGWNWLDFATVVSGVVDQWLLELWDNITQSENSDSEFGHMVTLARMLRLMRILRLVRVVKAIRPLRQLAIGVVRAMQSMFWVLVLTFVALYSLAILTTRMVGWGQLVDDPETLPAEAREMFSSMADSMFTLFAFMNGHEWHKVRPLLDLLPWMKPLFVGFTICGSWALLSVMTGVVSDHIQYVRVEQQREDDEAREERREQLTTRLSEIFASADTEGDGSLTRDAFMDIFASPYQVRRLQRAVNQPLADIKRVFDWLDIEGKGRIGFREFCEGLDCLEDTMTGQRLLQVDSGVKLQCNVLKKDIEAMSAEVQRFQEVLTAQHGELMQNIIACLEFAQEDLVPVAPLPVGIRTMRTSSSESSVSGSGSAHPSHISPLCSEATPAVAAPLQGTLKYQRSVSSLRSADTGGSRGLRLSKSVSFSEPMTA